LCARFALWLTIPATVGLEVWAFVHYQDAPDGEFALLAILFYAAFAAAAVLFLDLLCRPPASDR
jgi:hypothetical protein